MNHEAVAEGAFVIARSTNGRVRIHLSDGRGEPSCVDVTVETAQEIHRAFAAVLKIGTKSAEVSPFATYHPLPLPLPVPHAHDEQR